MVLLIFQLLFPNVTSNDGKLSSNQGPAKRLLKDRCGQVRTGAIVKRKKAVDTTPQKLFPLRFF